MNILILFTLIFTQTSTPESQPAVKIEKSTPTKSDNTLPSSPSVKSEEKKVEPPLKNATEGFESSGFESNSKKVKKLVDDRGEGEYVPNWMIEGTIGISSLTDIAVKTGPAVTASLLYRPRNDFWVGWGFDTRYNSGENLNDNTLSGSMGILIRYYFMPHREANRFIMAWVGGEMGLTMLKSWGTNGTGNDIKTETSGGYFGFSFGMARALSTRSYIGIVIKYYLNLWTDFCMTPDGGSKTCIGESHDFESHTLQTSIVYTYSF